MASENTRHRLLNNLEWILLNLIRSMGELVLLDDHVILETLPGLPAGDGEVRVSKEWREY